LLIVSQRNPITQSDFLTVKVFHLADA